jgi:ribosome modulation factor
MNKPRPIPDPNAYAQGLLAGIQRQPRTSCPYEQKTTAKWNWDDGYRQGLEADEQPTLQCVHPYPLGTPEMQTLLAYLQVQIAPFDKLTDDAGMIFEDWLAQMQADMTQEWERRSSERDEWEAKHHPVKPGISHVNFRKPD